MKKRILKRMFLIMCTVILLGGCSKKESVEENRKAQEEQETEAEKAEKEKEEREEQERIKKQREEEEQRKREEEERKKAEEEAESAKKPQIVVLDPGHSAVVAEGSEPLGPGSAEYKSADTGGTSGVSSGVPEYELTLNISMQLKAELENRGYTVIMTRETSDVPVSCIQRADVANNAGASAYVRIHANGSENQSAQGAMTICTTPQSPYVPELYAASRQLSDCILGKLCEATGCVNGNVWETDTMSGNNWSQVPVTIVEMGYMTNPDEDMLMQTPEYQAQIVQGIANGIEAFFGYKKNVCPADRQGRCFKIAYI